MPFPPVRGIRLARRLLAIASLLAALGPALPAQGQPCPAAANATADSGWSALRAGEAGRAGQLFERARARCPAHPGAVTGLGYVALRQGTLGRADSLFARALASDRRLVDAWVGQGLVAWRRDDLPRARRAFTEAQRLDPGNGEARDHLARVAAAERDRAGAAPPAPAARRAVVRPPLVRPRETVLVARTRGERFEVRTSHGWHPLYVKGVNIGAAMPGKYASEFPDSATYAGWFEQIGRLGANTIRVYTMHPPQFYGALRRYNLTHPEPLWLIHGVWAELPPEDVHYDEPAWEKAFFDDIRSVVDILHGRADLAPQPGRASGSYTADVSRWTLGFILGREWESHSVAGWNALRPALTSHRGRYLVMDRGTPMDAWMAKASEEAIRYEMERYNAQRPVAYTNWPTTDPLDHPAESSIMEEAAIRRWVGDSVNIRPVLEGEDVVTLDPSLVKATARFPAGWFASYHVYPYFPDFMVMSREFNAASSAEGRSNYWGYLVALQKRHRGIPLLISEYGVPSSIGIAHLHPQGWHHGGNPEQLMGEVNARMTREIAASGAAGGIVFEWIDEWFKKTWNTSPFEVPLDRNRLWHNRMDAEEHYGLLAMEAVPPRFSEPRVDGLVRVGSDASYLTVRVDLRAARADTVLLGFDILDRGAGGLAWPSGAGAAPFGLEFVLVATPQGARLLAHPSYNPLRVHAHAGVRRGTPLPDYPPVGGVPPGFFRGRYSFNFNLPLVPRATMDGVFEPLRVLTSRTRWMRDSAEVGAMGYDWGILPRGPLPDGLVEWDATSGTLEVRIPWQLLNVSDPSSRRVLRHPSEYLEEGAELATAQVEDVGIALATRGAGGWRSVGGTRYRWEGWEVPAWRARRKPSYDALREVWRTLDPVVLR